MAGNLDTATFARREWPYKEVSALFHETFPEARPCMNRCVLWADVGTPGRDPIIAYLRRRGYFMHMAENSLEALQFIRNRRPDCCLLDNDLAPVSGLELLETIGQDPACRGMSIFIVSATQGAEAEYEKKMCRFFRGVKVLKKPLTTPEILAELTALYPEPAELAR